MQYPWPHQVIPEYTAALRARLSEGVLVAPATVSIGEWKPQPNQCHDNVTVWCANNEGYQVIRGWLYMDMAGHLNYEVFLAHSVVRDQEGLLWDITPKQALQEYPFIAAAEHEEEYAALVGQGATRLVHYKQSWAMANPPARPNPSLERTSTGKPLGPRDGSGHHPSRGPSALPAGSAQLKR